MSDYTNTPIGSGYNATSAINTELSAVETAVNSKLDKSGSTMTGELDMNSKKIINLPDATTLQEPVTYGQMINGASFAASDAKYFDTVALATADTTLGVGDVVIIEERANGIFNVISGTSTANTYNIIAHGSLSLSLELGLEGGINVRQFGATGNGTTDDTSAIQAAIDTRRNVFIPDGTYLVSSLDYGTPSFANQMNITGAGRNEVILKGSGTGPILTIGSTSMTNFISNILISGIEFDGQGAGTTTEGVICYGLVESTFRDCTFTNCGTGLYDYGGIANIYENCKIGSSGVGNSIGLRFNNDATLFYTGDSNANIVRNCAVKANSQWGIYFDYGRQLVVDSCDIEGNGQSALGSDYGGIYVGSSAGARVTNYETGVVILNCWFEANTGKAEVWLNGGSSFLKNCYFRTASAKITSDIIIDRGQYSIIDCISNVAKTANIDETVSVNVQSGNMIMGGSFGNITYDPVKTTVLAERSENNNIAKKTKIATSDSGATASTDANHLVVESSGRTGITILSGNTNEGRVLFGDDGSSFAGWVEYDHSTNDMNFRVNGSTKAKLLAGGGLGLSNSAANTNTPSGATAHQLPIYDASGTLLGYIPIYAAAW